MATLRIVPQGTGWYIIEKKTWFGWIWVHDTMFRLHEAKEYIEMAQVHYKTKNNANKSKCSSKEL